MFVWPVNKHVNCQVRDIELQFIVALPRPHHTMLAISIAHLRMTWSTLFGRSQGEGWKRNFYSVESLWFSRSIPVMFWILSVIVKICRVQRCNVERVKKKIKTFLLHCWNCTFTPPNFLNLFSGSVWLWKFAGCKGAMLKGLYYFCSKLLELQLRTSDFFNLFWILDPCDCENRQGGPRTENRKVKVESEE